MGAMRILVVEDEHRIANNIKKGLEQERYAVDVAYDGTSGFDLASTEEYDLIVLDLMLPGMDGMAVCRDLRKQKIHTPILILTAKGQTAVSCRLDGGRTTTYQTVFLYGLWPASAQ
jgi:DNA-binding response OmpR family regulator